MNAVVEQEGKDVRDDVAVDGTEDATPGGAVEQAATVGDGTATSAGRGARLVAVGLVLLAAAAAAFFAFQASRASGERAARADALAAAQERVPELLSYDAATLEEDLADALAQTTGEFTADYSKILDDVVAPQATARKITTKAVVSAAGVVRGDRDAVVVLLFVTQTTTAGSDDTTVAGSRVEVTMEPVGDSWKIAALQPV